MKAAGLMGSFGGMCYYCRHPVRVGAQHPSDRATVDHDIPKCRIGFATPLKNNELLSCQECNQHKGDMTGAEFIQFRRDKKFAAGYIEYLEDRLAKRLKLGNDHGRKS